MNKNWTVNFLPETVNDFKNIDHSSVLQVRKVIERVSSNPLPQSEGGYGKPLGNNTYSRLANCCKIKLKKAGIRVVYKLIRKDTEMTIIIIGARKDVEVYRIAEERIKKHNI